MAIRLRWSSFSVQKIHYLFCISMIAIGLYLMRFHASSMLSSHRSANIVQKTPVALLTEASGKSAIDSPNSCVQPQLELWPYDLKTFFTPVPSLDCEDEESWIYTRNRTVYVTKKAREKHGKIICKYYPLSRGTDDFTVQYEEATKLFHAETSLSSDWFEVRCGGEGEKRYKGSHVGIRYDPELHKVEQNNTRFNSLDLNVLVMGFDSVSRMQWLRELPKTYDYLMETLGGLELESYNIVGDGTVGALTPMLTGKTEFELPEGRRGYKNPSTIDEYPWIWKELKKTGYVTQWGEIIAANHGTFQYKMVGFKSQPVDHYLRPFTVHAHDFYGNLFNCTGSMPSHQVLLNWVKEFFEMYQKKLKFSFVFHDIYSHDYVNRLHWADQDLVDFLKLLNSRGYLDNTLLILMADHGQQISPIRNTFQGKYEELKPFFSFRFPPSFKKQYPRAMDNFRVNTKRLTTPFDIYATFQDLLNFDGAVVGDVNDRGISLLKEIPQRTCEQAGIEPHWCTCTIPFVEVSVSDITVQKAANHLLLFINKASKDYRTECVEMSLLNITRSARYSGNRNAPDPIYQLTIFTTPNLGAYEATLRYSVATDTFRMSFNEVSRTNKYGSQPHCIMESLPDMRPYCYCRQQLS